MEDPSLHRLGGGLLNPSSLHDPFPTPLFLIWKFPKRVIRVEKATDLDSRRFENFFRKKRVSLFSRPLFFLSISKYGKPFPIRNNGKSDPSPQRRVGSTRVRFSPSLEIHAEGGAPISRRDPRFGEKRFFQKLIGKGLRKGEGKVSFLFKSKLETFRGGKGGPGPNSEAGGRIDPKVLFVPELGGSGREGVASRIGRRPPGAGGGSDARGGGRARRDLVPLPERISFLSEGSDSATYFSLETSSPSM